MPDHSKKTDKNELGRNDPCHCGSGRKYKKCCLGKDEETRREEQDAAELGAEEIYEMEQTGYEGSPGTGEGKLVRPYVRIKCEESPIIHYIRPDKRAGHRLWTQKKVARLTTESIIQRLAELGITMSPDRIPEETRGRDSAWDMGLAWREKAVDGLSADDEDFVGLAACELWKRCSPGRPSVEMIDDWITAGYSEIPVKRKDNSEGVRLWIRAWRALNRMMAASIRTLDAAEEFLRGSEIVSNWIGDLLETARNAALADAALAEEVLEVIDEIEARFPEPGENTFLFWEGHRAELLDMRGEAAKAERCFRGIIAIRPTSAQGYVGLAEMWGDVRPPLAPDFDRAIAILEAALAVPVTDARDWDVEVRLDDYRRERDRQARSAGMPAAVTPTSNE